ncbi:hypothetical protein GGR50DRAFT_677114 [Xylaria sp. CBS 124048]|nr:hypothetical protein GGR50DRAFT_677114 [Xylaria sp. CBS 124048]
MSSNRSESSSSLPRTYRTADGIIRSILDYNASPAEISPSGELYRAVERSYSYRRELVRSHLNRWASQNAMSSDENPDQQRTLPRPSPRESLPASAPTLPPLRSLTTQRPAAMSGSSQSNISAPARPPDQVSSTSRSLADPWREPWREQYDEYDTVDLYGDMSHIAVDERHLQDAQHFGTQVGNQSPSPLNERVFRPYPLFESIRSQLRPQSDYVHSASPLPELFPSLSAQQHEPPEENRQVKRRKLDSDRLTSNFQGFQYGKYGQVQPGHLKMELVSCDGGIFSDNTAQYGAQNILKNDRSVYCTEGPRCNIVLRHQGATVFTLKELVIKAPKSSFDSPVQAGMVFVAMTSDHLLNRTAQYQIQYLPPSQHTEREAQPLDPIISIRHHEHGSTMTGVQVRTRRTYNTGSDDEDNDDEIAQIPSEFNIPPPVQVTTECSDDEADGGGAGRSQRAPNRIGPLPFESDSNSDEDEIGFVDHRPRRRHHRSRTALAEAAQAAQIATQEAVRAVGGELLTPHARFFIKRDKSRCTIHFDPPISGRFILLKMWNPRNTHDNIDIQAVIAKGYAGPRFFPSIQLQ